MSYLDTLAEHRRLALLEVLQTAPGYGLHEYLIRDQLRALGIACTMDVLRGDLAWLADLGAVTVAQAEHASIAQLTERGADVAAGLASVPGIARPSPR